MAERRSQFGKVLVRDNCVYVSIRYWDYARSAVELTEGRADSVPKLHTLFSSRALLEFHEVIGEKEVVRDIGIQ